MNTPHASKGRRPTPGGFALLIALAMSAALLAIVAAMHGMATSANRARVAEKDVLLARQAAEAGLARARSDALKLTGTLQQSDLDCMLDPKLDSPDDTTNTSDNNMPPLAGTTVHANCNLITPWAGSTTETVNGLPYRKVLLDMDGDGTNDGAYLVRYDDNRDDMAPNPGAEATNNNPNSGGNEKVVDTPTRDRDMTIMISAIGLSGGTTFDTARGRRLLRATLRGQGGVAFVTPARAMLNGGMNETGKICGSGAMFCNIGEGTGRTPECACGKITTSDTSGEVWPDPVRQCDVPADCQSCEPLQVFNNRSAPCSIPDPPLPPTLDTTVAGNAMTVARFNNFRTTPANTCYFYVDKEAGFDVVYMFDNQRAGCTSWTANTAIPVPAMAYTNTNPGDCWVPVFNNSQPRDIVGGTPSATGDWQPGRDNSGANVIPVLDFPGRTTFASATITDVVSGVLYTRCGMAGAAPGAVIDFAGTTVNLFVDQSPSPRGIYFFSADYTTINILGSGGPHQRAVLAQTDVNYPAGLWLQNPVVGLHAVATAGACALGSGSGGRIDYGIWCDDGIGYQTNGLMVNGDMLSRGNIAYAGAGNDLQVAANVPPTSAWPATYTDCPSIATISGVDCSFKNGPVFCANITCSDAVEIKNNPAVYGTIYAGGDITLGNNGIIQPPASSMLGATPTITAIQDIGL